MNGSQLNTSGMKMQCTPLVEILIIFCVLLSSLYTPEFDLSWTESGSQLFVEEYYAILQLQPVQTVAHFVEVCSVCVLCVLVRFINVLLAINPGKMKSCIERLCHFDFETA